jgi:drug/metabolite transporter (DMT)-like permease
MKDPTAMGWPQSVALLGELELSKLIPQTRVHTGLLWAVLLGVLFWNEWPDRWLLIGALVVIGAGIYMSRVPAAR